MNPIKTYLWSWIHLMPDAKFFKEPAVRANWGLGMRQVDHVAVVADAAFLISFEDIGNWAD